MENTTESHLRECRYCNIAKPIHKFSRKRTYPDMADRPWRGVAWVCKSCHRKPLAERGELSPHRLEPYTYTARKTYRSWRGMPYKAKKGQRDKYLRNVLSRWKRIKGCAKCGLKPIHGAILDLDHIDPSTKTSRRTRGAIDAMINMSKVNAKRELSLCQVLCKNCHAEKTLRERGIIP